MKKPLLTGDLDDQVWNREPVLDSSECFCTHEIPSLTTPTPPPQPIPVTPPPQPDQGVPATLSQQPD